MKTRRKKTALHAVLLPWERRQPWLGGLSSGRRWRSLLMSGLVGLFIVTSWNVADYRARVRSTRASIADVKRAIATFRAELGRCPTSKIELVHPPRAGARYLAEVPPDGWGRELLVRCPAPEDPSDAEVISAGPSGSFSEDDHVL
jgi:hypothetical protein